MENKYNNYNGYDGQDDYGYEDEQAFLDRELDDDLDNRAEFTDDYAEPVAPRINLQDKLSRATHGEERNPDRQKVLLIAAGIVVLLLIIAAVIFLLSRGKIDANKELDKHHKVQHIDGAVATDNQDNSERDTVDTSATDIEVKPSESLILVTNAPPLVTAPLQIDMGDKYEGEYPAETSPIQIDGPPAPTEPSTSENTAPAEPTTPVTPPSPTPAPSTPVPAVPSAVPQETYLVSSDSAGRVSIYLGEVGLLSDNVKNFLHEKYALVNNLGGIPSYEDGFFSDPRLQFSESGSAHYVPVTREELALFAEHEIESRVNPEYKPAYSHALYPNFNYTMGTVSMISVADISTGEYKIYQVSYEVDFAGQKVNDFFRIVVDPINGLTVN